jgi:anaerobic magnesium-protoporphyrin IX monomethyl ester cyclase
MEKQSETLKNDGRDEPRPGDSIESLDILLVNASFGRRHLDDVVAKMPNVGLLSLASFCLSNGITVELLDTDLKQMGKDEIKAYAMAMTSAPRYIGVSSTTITIYEALDICEIFKTRFPETIIIVGGAHASVMPEHVLASPYVDMVVRREGEFALLDLIKARIPLEQIAGLSFKQNGEIVHNPDRELLRDLDSLPLPAYHLIDINKCRPSMGCYKRLPAVPVLTSKGCTGNCSFCGTHVFGRRIRFKSPARVIEELSYLIENYQVPEIVFYDDVFTASKARTLEICNMIIDKGWNITWSCLCRADQTPRDLLSKMKEAGCHTISYGVESADEGILTTMNKRINLATVEEAVKNCKELGIEQRLAFMFGTPGETPDTMRRTFEFAKRLDPMHAVFNITTPFPGSEMFASCERNETFITKDWRRFDGSESLLKLPTVTKEEVEQYCSMSREYFLNRYSERQ